MQASALLLRWGRYCRARNVRVLIVYLFFRAAQLASIRQMSRRVSRGSAGDYEADEQAGVACSAVDYQADEQAGIVRLS